MANSEDGVILVSFGTVLQASLMSDDLRLKLTSVFGQLKQRILWKWESEEMENKPDNVMLSKWLPQQDILAHPKLRLFITHGGQSSSQEALCHKKPVVGRIYSTLRQLKMTKKQGWVIWKTRKTTESVLHVKR